MEHYYKIDRSSSLEHGIRDLFRVNGKKKKGSSYREKSKTGDETGVWTNAHGKQREAAGPAWKKKDNDDETRESGKKGNKSKYEGGFITKNGRSNNSPAYNHDYYMKNKDKWYDRVPENPTESDVKRARMNANSSISAANKMAETLLKDADKETVKRLGWDKWTADQIGGAVNRSLESMVTASRYKRQNSLGQKAKDAAEDVKKKATYYVDRAKNRASELTRKPSELQNRPTADEMLRTRAQSDQERRNSSHSEPYYSPRKSNNGKNDTSRHANNSINGRSTPDPEKMSKEWRQEMGYEPVPKTKYPDAAPDPEKMSKEWRQEMGYEPVPKKKNSSVTPDPNKMSKEYKEELEYNSRKNKYPNQSSNSSDKKRSGNVSWEFGTPELTSADKKKNTSSSSDKYVTYKNKSMEAGTLYKDKDGNIWKKLGGPGTNNWMKVN